MVAILGGVIVVLMFVIAGMWATIVDQRDELAALREIREPHMPNPWHEVPTPQERATLHELWPAGDAENEHEPTLVSKV